MFIIGWVQFDQLNMTMFFWYIVKSDLSNVHVYSGVHGTNHNTWPYLTGHPVYSTTWGEGGMYLFRTGAWATFQTSTAADVRDTASRSLVSLGE